MKKVSTTPYDKKCAYCGKIIHTQKDYYAHSITNDYWMHLECFNQWDKELKQEMEEKAKHPEVKNEG